MKKLFFGAIFLMATNAISAQQDAYSLEPNCAKSSGNNGVCYNTYDADGKVNGSNCTNPGANSTAIKDCTY